MPERRAGALKQSQLGLVRKNHILAGIGTALLAVSLVVAVAYGAGNIYLAELRAETRRTEQDRSSVAGLLRSLLGRYAFLAKSLVVNARFSFPPDDPNEVDRVILSSVSDQQARLISHYDGVQTWLQTEVGPALPIPTEGSGNTNVALWRVTRGLPIRSSKGKLLAQSRRLLADQVIQENPEILSIAELDNRSRVIFMTPYAGQIKLTAFNFAQRLKLRVPNDNSRVAMTERSPFVDSPTSPTIGFVATGIRRSGRFWLLITVRSNFPELARLSEQGISAVLYDQTGHGILASPAASVPIAGLEPINPPTLSMLGFLRFLWLGKSPDRAADAPIQIQGSSYHLAIVESSRIATAPFTALIVLTILLASGMFLFSLWRIGYSLGVISLQQGEINDAQETHKAQLQSVYEAVESSAKDLAHSYKNSLFSLRASIEELTGSADLNSQVKLNKTLDDLHQFSEILSLELAPKALAHAGALDYAQPEAVRSTYLRGTLQYVVDGYSSRFGKNDRDEDNLSLIFSPELDSQEPFVAIRYTTLTNIANNILMNALEACSGIPNPRALIRVFQTGSDISIQFSDNGCGIPLANQGELFSGRSSTKGKGHGKGLQGSKNTAEEEGAKLELVHSQPGDTVMQLKIRRCETPSWFAGRIPLTNKSVVVVVDDESAVGDYFQKALAKLCTQISLPEEYGPRCIKLRSPIELIKDNNGALTTGTVFLVDYLFAEGERLNGIQLIEELGLQKKAILVTAHTDKPEVIDEVVRRGLRVLPKTYMYSARFRIEIGTEDD